MSKKSKTFPMEVQQGSVTVKIYRVRNKAYRKKKKVQRKARYSFTVSFFASGKRTQKMFADFDEAWREADSKAKSLSKGEHDVLELRTVDRIAYIHSLEMLQPTGMALELAVKDYAEAWKVLDGKASMVDVAREYARRKMDKLPEKLLPDAVKEMLDTREKDGTSNAYLKVLKVYLGQLAEVFKCHLTTVTTSQIADFLRNQKVSARSKNNSRQTIGAFLKFCRERGWLARDHEGISMVPKFKNKATDIEIFTPWEVTQFLTYSRPELVPFLAIGAFAGLRSAEIERLDWKEVHLSERFIEVKAAKAKTASRRLVPISDNLAAWLKTPAKDKEAGPVVPYDNMAKQIGWLVEDTNAGLQKAAKEAGKDPEKARQVKWKKNALRHSFISYRVAEIQNVNQVALEAGNSPQIIFAHYRELVRLKETKAWFGIVPPTGKADSNPNPQAPAVTDATEPPKVIVMEAAA